MLASTVQFSTNNQPPPPTPPPAPPPRQTNPTGSTHQTNGGTRSGQPRTRDNHPHPPPHPTHTCRSGERGPFPQDPTACLRTTPPPPGPPPHPTPHIGASGSTGSRPRAGDRTGQRSTLELRHE